MSNVAIIPQFNLSAELAALYGDQLGADDLSQGVSSGFPLISIRGAKWRLVQGGEESPIRDPQTQDLAPSIKVVLMRANANMSKVFYAGQFVEGSDSPPDCSSGDGIAPYADSPKVQSDKCATCKNNVWGSKVSPSGAKIKACADVRRMAILPAEDLDFSPILLRVPGASLSDLAAYGKALKQRHIPYAAVVTKLAFDADAAYPKITFTFDRVLTAEEMQHVASRLQEPVIDDILGLSDRVTTAALPAPQDDKFGIPADAGKQVAANQGPSAAELQADVDNAARAEAAAVAAEMEAAAKPKTTRKPTAKASGFGGGAEPEASTQPAAAATPAAQPDAGGDMMSDIDAALAGLDF